MCTHVLTVPSLKHIVNDVIHETYLRFRYRTRGSVKHRHHYWQMMDFLFVGLKVKINTHYTHSKIYPLRIDIIVPKSHNGNVFVHQSVDANERNKNDFGIRANVKILTSSLIDVRWTKKKFNYDNVPLRH